MKRSVLPTFFNFMVMIIAMAGGSASGKTTVLNKLALEYEGRGISFISSDNYYKEQALQSLDEEGEINYDLPSALYVDKLVQDITDLKNGKTILVEEYTFNNPNAQSNLLKYEPRPIIIVEGLFVFHFQALQPLLDYKVLVDAPENVRLERRLKRDAIERGYPEKAVQYQWTNHVLPAYKKYLSPYKSEANLIIDTQLSFEKDYQKLCAFLDKQLQE